MQKYQIIMPVNKITHSTTSEEVALERQLQINSILRILWDSMDKLRISLILPKIFENLVCVRQRLIGSKYENCIHFVQDYIKEKKMDPTNIPPHLNYRLIKIIDFFHENRQVLDYFNDWLNDLNPADKSLMESFQLLLMLTKQHLNKCALSELRREKKVHEIYQENEKVKRNIKAIQKLLKSLHINMKWKMAAEEVLIKKYEKDLAVCKYESSIKIKREIVRSSCNIRQIHLSSVAKQKELGEELERVRVTYERLLTENLMQERSARDEKNKLLLQLEVLINKFDQTMGDKIKENMNLQEEFATQNELFDKFMIEYDREEAEYERIVRVKEEEEKRQHEQTILLFMMNRSARVIQKLWRKFRRAQKKTVQKSKSRGKKHKK